MKLNFFKALLVAAFLPLAACTADQVSGVFTTVQADQAKVAAAISEGCSVANAAAAVAAPFAAVPQVAGILTFVTAGCGTAEAVAALTTKAVNDPSTIAWVQQLAVDVNKVVVAIKG